MTTEHVSILPESSTALEKHIEFTLDTRVLLKDRILRISDIKYKNIPDDLVPWLLYQYGLLPVSQYLPKNPDTAIIEGLSVQRLKGTRAGLLKALSWIGFVPDKIDLGRGEDFGQYQFDTGKVPSFEELKGIVNLSEFAEARRDELFRLYHGLNIPPLILNSESTLNNSILNNFSGTYDEELGVWLSFADVQGYQITYDLQSKASASFGASRLAGYTANATSFIQNSSVSFGNYQLSGYTATYNGFTSSTEVIYPDKITNDITYIADSGD